VRSSKLTATAVSTRWVWPERRLQDALGVVDVERFADQFARQFEVVSAASTGCGSNFRQLTMRQPCSALLRATRST
jgi:hypothetical protein